MPNFSFNISELLKKPEGESFEVGLNQKIDLESEVKAKTPFAGSATFIRIDEGIEVQVSGKITLIVPCGRCGKDFETAMKISFSKTFWENPKLAAEPTEIISPKGEIELFPYIRAEILVQIPIKPLCSKLCQSIQPKIESPLKKPSPFDILKGRIK